jgi:NAD(P)-dependent dehydrogenase (short-subunit alcohol dehydrogenase family)
MAVAFAEAGADIAVNWLDSEEAAAKVAAQVQSKGRRAILVQGDVGRVEDAKRIVTETAAGLGRIDVLINNAGVFPRVPMLEMTEADWDHVHSINLRGGFFCAQTAIKAMIAGGHGGSILNLSSLAIRGSSPHGVHYSASKSGVVGMTRALALDAAKYDVRVNAVAPGLTDTAQPRYGASEEELAETASQIPLGRMVRADEIADLGVFLCSDKAAMITGQTYHVNGGTYAPG